MTFSDFKEWLRSHDAAFPGFQAWIESGDNGSVKQRLQLWFDQLREVTLEQARSATKVMFGSDTKPKFFSEHIDWILARFRPRQLANSTQPLHLICCQMCNGTGICSVVFFRPQHTEGGMPLPENRGPAACKCSRGKWLNDRRREHPEGRLLPAFDSLEMRLDIPEPLTEREREELLERLKRHNPRLLQVILRGDRMYQQRDAEVIA